MVELDVPADFAAAADAGRRVGRYGAEPRRYDLPAAKAKLDDEIAATRAVIDQITAHRDALVDAVPQFKTLPRRRRSIRPCCRIAS